MKTTPLPFNDIWTRSTIEQILSEITDKTSAYFLCLISPTFAACWDTHKHDIRAAALDFLTATNRSDDVEEGDTVLFFSLHNANLNIRLEFLHHELARLS